MMLTDVVKSGTMPVNDYVTIEEAMEHEDVEFTSYWLRALCRNKKIKAVKLGDARRGQWLIYMPSLLEYIKEMDKLGTKKHSH